MDTAGFWEFCNTFFVIFIVLMVVLSLLQAYISQRSAALKVDSTAQMQNNLVKFIMLTMQTFCKIFFWFVFAMCAWWFIFFKLQQRVYCFLPPLGSYLVNYKAYDDMLISLVVLKFVSLAYEIVFEQSSMDIFLIDWESPKMFRHRGYMPKQAVNPWRRLFIANEFNEL